MATEPLFNFVVTRGNTFPIDVIFAAGVTPVDLTGYTAEFVVRRASSDDDTAIVGPLTSPSRITLGGVAGTVSLELTPTETNALIHVDGALNAYELRVISGAGKKTTVLKGIVEATYSALEDT